MPSKSHDTAILGCLVVFGNQLAGILLDFSQYSVCTCCLLKAKILLMSTTEIANMFQFQISIQSFLPFLFCPISLIKFSYSVYGERDVEDGLLVKVNIQNRLEN